MSKNSVVSDEIEPKELNEKEHEWKDSELYEDQNDEDLSCWEKFRRGASNFYSRTIDYFEFDRIFQLEGERKIDFKRCQGRFLQNFDETYSERQVKFAYTFEDVLREKQKEQERKEKHFCRQFIRFICCQGGNEMIQIDELYKSERQYEVLLRKKIFEQRKDQYFEEMAKVNQEGLAIEDPRTSEPEGERRQEVMVSQNVFFNEGEQEEEIPEVKQTVIVQNQKKVKVEPVSPQDNVVVIHEEHHHIKRTKKTTQDYSDEEENQEGRRKNKIMKPNGTSSELVLKQGGDNHKGMHETVITRNIYHENHIYQDVVHENHIHHTTNHHKNTRVHESNQGQEVEDNIHVSKKKRKNKKKKQLEDEVEGNEDQDIVYASPRHIEGSSLTFEQEESPREKKKRNKESSPERLDLTVDANAAVKKRKAKKERKQLKDLDEDIIIDSPKRENEQQFNNIPKTTNYSKTIDINNKESPRRTQERNDFSYPQNEVEASHIEGAKKKRKRKDKKQRKQHQEEDDEVVLSPGRGMANTIAHNSSSMVAGSGLYMSNMEESQIMEVKVEKKRRKNKVIKEKIAEDIDEVIDLDL